MLHFIVSLTLLDGEQVFVTLLDFLSFLRALFGADAFRGRTVDCQVHTALFTPAPHPTEGGRLKGELTGSAHAPLRNAEPGEEEARGLR